MELEGNPYQLEIARNLTIAMFYFRGYYIHEFSEKENLNIGNITEKQFASLVESSFCKFFKRETGLSPKDYKKQY